MKLLSLGLGVLAMGCATAPTPKATVPTLACFPQDTAREARSLPPDKMIEVTMAADGSLAEVEFHVDADRVPQAIRAQMDAIVPGGKVVGAEKEYVHGRLHWEITKEVDGKKLEVLFDTEGKAKLWEVEVEQAAVPAEVLSAARAGVQGDVRSIEEIRDSDKRIVEYHVKLNANGVRWKMIISPTGTRTRVYREVPAEIEVPVTL